MKGMEMCMLCHFNPHSSEMNNLERMKQILTRKHLDTRRIKRYRHFTWGVGSERCRFGVTCHKVTQYRSNFNSITRDMDALLSAYIEQTDKEELKKEKFEILRLMQGHFPGAYRDFEREVNQI